MAHSRSKWVRVLAPALGVILLLTACSSNDEPGPSGTTSADPQAGVITANNAEPQNPLVPTNTNELSGLKILRLVFAGLVYYDAAGTPQNDLAESITSTDSQNYTITIKAGESFSNGEPVTASSFVDAWNYGALSTNAQINASYFSTIAGYEDVSFCEEGKGPAGADGEPTCLPAPKAQTLSGLKVVSDTEFTVALTLPQSDFAISLGYAAFMPLPSVAYDDIAAYGQSPIGNGPYKVSSWQHGAKLDLVPNSTYQGDRVAKNNGVTFLIYTSADAEYADLLSDNLDVMDVLPASSLSSFETDLGERAVNEPSATFSSITIPGRLPHMSGAEGALRRAALSMAIDRPSITDKIFYGTRTPARDFSSPVIQGYSDSLPGNEVLDFNPTQAQALWAQANAIAPWDGSFDITYNADSANKEWVEAVCNSIKNTLQIESTAIPVATFGEIRQLITTHVITTAFRTQWGWDWPSMYNGLQPLYVTGASGNDGEYSDPEFDALISQAASTLDQAAADALFQQAQAILLRDLPVLPLWYANVTGGHSTKVSNVDLGWDAVPLYYPVTKNG